MRFIAEKIDVGSLELKDQVVSINRVTKVVKGGKNLSFSALVVVGDGKGHVGYGMGQKRLRAIGGAGDFLAVSAESLNSCSRLYIG